VDAAAKAGVKHIVHLGIFGEWDITNPHFAWHQLIENYIEASGLAWTHLHLNMFMDNLLTATAPKADHSMLYVENRRVGWIVVSDIAAMAVAVLQEGPDKHHEYDYWMSTGVPDGAEVLTILSEVTGRNIAINSKGPDDFEALVLAPGLGANRGMWRVELIS
jgi:uncharacterized protein YbjT (DUF2867 family)